MNTIISFIIPAYNAGKYLSRCLDSVLAQDLSTQIIVVNDGSTDNTHSICQDYSLKYKNIEYINLVHNRGVSFARNEGIKSARGKFIFFVDADDYIEENCCKKLLDKVSNQDLVVFGKIYDRNGDKQKTNMPYKGQISSHELIHNNLDIFLNVHTSCWVTNKLYKADIIKNNNVFFDTKLEFAEDLKFNLSYFNYCKEVLFKDMFIAYYNRNVEGSLSRKYECKNISEVVKQRRGVLEFLAGKQVVNLDSFYLDTKNIIVYAVKKVIFSNISNEDKIKELNFLKLLDEKIIKKFDNDNYFENLIKEFIKNNNLKIMECKNEKL